MMRRNNAGFTLIELLVVVAIIAILVAIIVVAINPAQRLRESLDRVAASNIRSSGTLIGVCVTSKLSEKPAAPYEECADIADLNTYGTVPSEPTVYLSEGADPGDDDVCVAAQGSPGSGGIHYIYRFSTGSVEPITGVLDTMGSSPFSWCP